jgi:hypothetical protein
MDWCTPTATDLVCQNVESTSGSVHPVIFVCAFTGSLCSGQETLLYTLLRTELLELNFLCTPTGFASCSQVKHSALFVPAR